MSRITRRRFVKSSVAATVGIAAAPRITRADSPNEKISVALIGAGGRGNAHLGQYLNNERTEVQYIVDVDEKVGNAKCDVVQKKQGKRPQMVRDMRDVFDDPSVDVISTATPNHWHALCGVWAMQAGKDVYIEKPVSHNIAEGTALVAAARKYNRICQTGTQTRSNPAARNGIKFLQSGEIGEVNFARGLCYKRRKSIGPKGNYPVPDGVDFNLWSGPAQYTVPKVTRERFHYDWHWQRMYGNGDLGNQGPHQTDIARWGLGIDTHPNSVISYGGRLGYQAEREDPNYVDAGDTANTEVSIYHYGDKSIVFETRGLAINDPSDEELSRLFQSNKGNKIGVVFYGSEGYLVQRTYSRFIAYNKSFEVIQEFSGGSDNFHFNNFLEACVSRRVEDLNADVREGHLSAAISHLGNISYYLGEHNYVSVDELREVLASVPSLDDNHATLERTVAHLKNNKVDLAKYPISMGPLLEFDPQQEVFPESPEATELVSRPYRKAFVCPSAGNV